MMKATLLSICILTAAGALAEQPDLRITQFGAVGDGRTLNTTSIQRAIDSCAYGGGGTVCIPPGVFVSGALRLRSNVQLVIENGGTLLGSARLADYTIDGKRVGLLFTQDAENVTVTGPGTIDGNSDAFMEAGRAKKIDSVGSSWTRQKGHFRELAGGIGDGPLVPKDRPFQMIIFSHCRNVNLRDLRITRSPFWTVHFADCDGVRFSGVKIWCDLLVPNNDGADFTSCSNVQVSDCDIRTGDDCLVFTGYSHHFNLPGFEELRHVSENITVTNCTLISRSSAIRIGGFDQNTMRNYTFSNLTIDNSNRGIGLFVRDEGSIEYCTFANIIIHTRLHTGDWWGNGEPIHLSAVRLTPGVRLGKIHDVKFQNIICRSEAGIILYGTSESVIQHITFDNVSLQIVESPLNAVAGGNFDLRPVLDPSLQLFAHDVPGFFAQHVENLRLRDFDLTWDSVRAPFFTNGLEVTHFSGLSIDGFRGTGAPCNRSAVPIAISHGDGCEIHADLKAVRLEDVKK